MCGARTAPLTELALPRMLGPQGAVLAILGAFLANMTVKLVLAGWIGGRKLLLRVAPRTVASTARPSPMTASCLPP